MLCPGPPVSKQLRFEGFRSIRLSASGSYGRKHAPNCLLLLLTDELPFLFPHAFPFPIVEIAISAEVFLPLLISVSEGAVLAHSYWLGALQIAGQSLALPQRRHFGLLVPP